VLDEATKEKVAIPADSFKQYDDFIAKAQDAFNQGNYVQARQHAKQAEDALEHVKKAVEEINKEEDEGDNNNRGKNEEMKGGENRENKTSTSTPEKHKEGDRNERD